VLCLLQRDLCLGPVFACIAPVGTGRAGQWLWGACGPQVAGRCCGPGEPASASSPFACGPVIAAPLAWVIDLADASSPCSTSSAWVIHPDSTSDLFAAPSACVTWRAFLGKRIWCMHAHASSPVNPARCCKLQVLDPERRVVFLDTTCVASCVEREEDGAVSNPGVGSC